MSDKDWKKEALALVVLLRAKCSDEEWANMESRFAAECMAPAPQPGLQRAINDELADLRSKWNAAATPQVTPELELEQEADGRCLAAYTRFPGVAAYGPSKEEAIRNAAKVLIQPDVCPRCGSKFPSSYLWECWPESQNVPDSWHGASEQASPTPELGTCQDHHATITPSTPHTRTPYCCEWQSGEVERG